jgi:hypothetical protein
MFGCSQVHDLVVRIKEVCLSLLAGQVQMQQRLLHLEQHIDKDRHEDRQFIMSVVTLLSHPQQQVAKLNPYSDLTAELPLGHPEGYTYEELGIYDRPQTRQQDQAHSPAQRGLPDELEAHQGGAG